MQAWMNWTEIQRLWLCYMRQRHKSCPVKPKLKVKLKYLNKQLKMRGKLQADQDSFKSSFFVMSVPQCSENPSNTLVSK